jgi:hypothetical protein
MTTSKPESINLDAVECKQKSGCEPIRIGSKVLPVSLIDFWRWSYSNILGNTLRGHLAEFIVGYGLDCLSDVRQEWASCDLVKGNIRIEVKSASYLQSWKQDKLSSIGFDIAPKRGWDPLSNSTTTTQSRASGLYVFCLLHHDSKSSVEPLDVSQWRFYLVPTNCLNAHFQGQQRVWLGSLKRMQFQPVGFDALQEQFHKVMGTAMPEWI